MSGYKLVPVEPTPGMLEAYESASIAPVGPISKNGYRAMLDAAPAVHGEPDVPPLVEALTTDLSARINRVSRRSLDGTVIMCGEEWNGIVDLVKKLLTTDPQPAEKQPTRRKKPMSYPNGLDMESMPGLVEALEMRVDGKEPVIDNPLYAPQPTPNAPTFHLGDHVRKTKGSQWKGRVVGTYSTTLTPEGYAVESDTEKGSVQIYPAGALELVGEQPPC